MRFGTPKIYLGFMFSAIRTAGSRANPSSLCMHCLLHPLVVVTHNLHI